MKNLICWICDVEKAYQAYQGTQLLDEEGNKPCFDCLTESGAFSEAIEESEDDNEF